MLKTMTVALSLLVVISAPAWGVGITGVKDSADFAFKYEADVLPDAAGLGFTLQDPNNIFADTVSIGGGVLTINTNTNSTANDFLYYQIAGGSPTWSPLPQGDFTVEIRTLVRPNNSGVFGATLGMGDVNSNGNLGLFFDKVDMGGTDIATAANNDGFHVYRIASFSTTSSSAQQVYRIYRDGVQIGGDVPQITNFASHFLRLGDFISGAPEANFDIDYLRWDTTGAYEPIPEPASLGLVVGGVLMLLGRRKY